MKLYNTLTRTLEEFRPLDPQGKRVTMYVCGPTVYDVPHIGHARSAYVFDVLRRYLAFKRYQVTFVRNVTDVDDKIIDRARQEPGPGDLNAKCQAVAERYLQSYHETMDRLGIQRPDEEPKATDHVVPTMTDFIAKLLMQGVAYEAKGDVYFAVRKFEGYGKLSNRTVDELQAGARVEPGEQKQDPLDFALWKASKPGEPTWNSPWGAGRPGWHIECSAMSTKLLGEAFDIHGGGVDLVFPHHENEIAQAQAAGKPFAKYWIHNGLLTVDGEKMSKSLGNFITVGQALKDYPHPDYLKLFFLKTHYRSPIDYSVAKMEEAKKNWQEFGGFFEHYKQQRIEEFAGGKSIGAGGKIKDRFQNAMDDDLNTPQAIAALFDGVNLGKGLLSSRSVSHPQTAAAAKSFHDALVECGGILGLFYNLGEIALTRQITELFDQYKLARGNKDFKTSDSLRKQLSEQGFVVQDTGGTSILIPRR